MKKLITIIFASVAVMTAMAAIQRITILKGSELQLNPDCIVHLPGIGLTLQCSPDSSILLDDPNLSAIHWIEPNNSRDRIVCGDYVYAAEADSIYRVETSDDPRKFVARIDNEQFRLYPATDSTFFVCTADEEYSNLLLIDPEANTCLPYGEIHAPISKVATLNGKTMLWIDDQIDFINEAGNLEYAYDSPLLTDMTLCEMGIIAATTEGAYLVMAPHDMGKIINESVERVWWDPADILYFLTTDGDIKAIIGMREAYIEHLKKKDKK